MKLVDLEDANVFEFEWQEKKLTAFVAHPPSPVKNEPGFVWITIGELGAGVNDLAHTMEPLRVLKVPIDTTVRKSNDHLRFWVLGN